MRLILVAFGLATGCDPSPVDAGTHTSPDAGEAAEAGRDADVDARTAADASSEAEVAETPDAPRKVENLTHNALWQSVDAADDPFDDRPDDVLCPETALAEESLGGVLTFFVDSGKCNYAVVSQPSRAVVRAGDQLQLRFRHFPLTGPDGGVAEAHLAFMLGEVLIAERTIPIPAEEAEYEVIWRADERFAAGTPVYFHVHNHGQNEYTVISIAVHPGS